MVFGSWPARWAVAVALLMVACIGGTAWAQAAQNTPVAGGLPGREQLPRPVYRVATQPAAAATVAANNNPIQPLAVAPPAGKGHPLDPALQMAYTSFNLIRGSIKDYSATMIKQERINGKLNDPEFMFIKVRHEPFSVYLYFLGPERIRGQEALYVEGQNNGNLLGHGVGIKKIIGTVPLQPNGDMAMAGQRYPITEIGILNLTKRLIEVGEADKKFDECEVKFWKGTKIKVGPNIKPRSCMCIQVTHPVPRKNFKFYEAYIYVDDELNIPIRYESYDWPEKPGGKKQLLESYTYVDIKLNNGFTDADFSENNKQYGFH
jgi:hypothetical protein